MLNPFPVLHTVGAFMDLSYINELLLHVLRSLQLYPWLLYICNYYLYSEDFLVIETFLSPS